MNGNVLSRGTVVFHPNKEKGNTSTFEPRGIIRKSGQYEIRCEDKSGAPAGWYRVSVVSVDPRTIAPDAKELPRTLIDGDYADPATSGIEVVVATGRQKGAYDISLNRPKR